MRVYIIDQLDQYILELSLVLTKSLGVMTTIDSDKNKIEKFIEEGLDAEVVIFNESLFNRDDVQELYRKISQKNDSFPVISRHAGDFSDLVLDFSIEKNLEFIGNLLKDKTAKPSGKFVSVSIYKLLTIEPHNLGCDLFIKILKNGQDHYVKRLHANDQFSKKEIEKYIENGLREFYIPEEQYEVFINIMTMELIKTYQTPKEANLDFFPVFCTTFEIICERYKILKVDDLLKNLVDEYIKQIRESLKYEDELPRFLSNIKEKKQCYTFIHSYLCGILTYQLAVHYEWQSDQAKEALIYLSMFHDISLLDTDLSQFHTMVEIENFDEKTKKRILEHAAESAAIVEKFNNVPFGLTQMIREHHGEKEGEGFATSLSLNVSPMVMMFIVIEEFATQVIKVIGKNPKIDHEKLKKENAKIIKALEKSYSKLTYQKTVQELAILLDKIDLM